MNRYKKSAVVPLLSVILFYCSVTTFAQTDKSKIILNRFEQNFEKLDSLILGHGKGYAAAARTAQVKATALFPKDNADAMKRADSALVARSYARLHELGGITGLQFSGQTYYRLDEGLGIDDEDAVSGYKGKVQAEVRWDFLHSGLYNRKGRAGEVALEEAIDRNRYRKENKTRTLKERKEAMLAIYEKALAGVLLHHTDNLKMLGNAQSYLLTNENISSDQLLLILNERAECERQLATLGIKPSECVRATDLSTPENVTLSIDTLRLFNEIRRTDLDLETLRLRMKLLEQREKNTKYWGTTSITPFVRYSYYVRNDMPNSSNVDAGVAFSLPLSNETARKRRTMKAERDLLEIEGEMLRDKSLKEVRLIVDDIERMNRAAEGELQRLKDIKSYIAMRVNAYNNRMGGYNLLARAKEYNNYFSCWEKMLEFQYRRNCLMADLQAFLTGTSLTKYLKVIDTTVTTDMTDNDNR